MSYTVAPSGPKPRPGVVTAATIMLYLSALLLIAYAALNFVQIGPASDAVKEVYADEPEVLDATGAAITIVFVIFGAIAVLIALGLVLLGVFVGKGKQPARVTTWIVAGLAVLCLGCSAASSALGNLNTGGTGDPKAEELTRLLTESTPGWVTAGSIALTIASLLLMILVIILLALPASNDFFRKEQEVWVPPTGAPWATDPNLPPPGGSLPPPPGPPPGA